MENYKKKKKKIRDKIMTQKTMNAMNCKMDFIFDYIANNK